MESDISSQKPWQNLQPQKSFIEEDFPHNIFFQMRCWNNSFFAHQLHVLTVNIYNFTPVNLQLTRRRGRIQLCKLGEGSRRVFGNSGLTRTGFRTFEIENLVPDHRSYTLRPGVPGREIPEYIFFSETKTQKTKKNTQKILFFCVLVKKENTYPILITTTTTKFIITTITTTKFKNANIESRHVSLFNFCHRNSKLKPD